MILTYRYLRSEGTMSSTGVCYCRVHGAVPVVDGAATAPQTAGHAHFSPARTVRGSGGGDPFSTLPQGGRQQQLLVHPGGAGGGGGGGHVHVPRIINVPCEAVASTPPIIVKGPKRRHSAKATSAAAPKQDPQPRRITREQEGTIKLR